MNLGLALLIAAILLIIFSAAGSFFRKYDSRFQFLVLIIMTFSTGILVALLSSYKNPALMVWPVIFAFRIYGLATDIMKQLPKRPN